MTFDKLRKAKFDVSNPDLLPEVHNINDPRGSPDPRFRGRTVYVGDNVKMSTNLKHDMALLDRYVKGDLKTVGWDKVCGQCLVPDTPIITGEGIRPISEVKEDDLVLTHLGRYRRITRVFSRDYDGELVSLGVQGKGTISLTPEHPVYARQLSYYKRHLIMQSFSWISAGKLEAKKFGNAQQLLVMPRLRQTECPTEISAEVMYKWHLRRMKVPASQALMTVVGYYLAEGSVISGKGRGQFQIIYSFGHNLCEYVYVKELTDAFSFMGINSRVDIKKGIQKVTVNCAWLARFIAKEFGVKSYGKRVPLWAKLLPPEYLETLLMAYLKGDGHEMRQGYYVGATTSYQLAHAIKELALKLGYNASVYLHTFKPFGTILGRKVRLHQQYPFRIFDRKTGNRNSQRADADNLYVRIQRLEKRPYRGRVYNLEVEEDNSFCTTLFAVHNCIYFYRDPNLRNKKHGRCRAYGFKEVHEELSAEVKQNYTEPDGKFVFGLWPGCPTFSTRDRLSRR